MTRIYFNGAAGPGNNLSWVGGNVWSHVDLPVAREAMNLTRPILIRGVYLYAGGRYGTVSTRFWAANEDGGEYVASGLFNLGQQYPANTLIGAGVTKLIGAYGQRIRVGCDASGLTTYGRHANGAFNVYSGNNVQWGGNFLAGELDYHEVPLNPRDTDAAQLAPGQAICTWLAPADDGGTPVTGYIVQRTTALPWGSAPIQQVAAVAGARSFRFDGLTPGTHFFRVCCQNEVTAWAGTNSHWSNTKQLQITTNATGDLDGWTRWGAMPAGLVENTTAGLRRTVIDGILPLGTWDPKSVVIKENFVTGASATLNPNEHGAWRTVDGLTPGRVYRYTANAVWMGEVVQAQYANTYQIGVDGIGWAPAVELSAAKVGYSMGTYEFVATATSHKIGYRLAESVTRTGAGTDMEAFAIFDVQLVEMPTSISPFRLQNVAYESSLVNHFDLACNSVGGYWWVDRGGVTQFAASLGEDAVVGVFSDVRGDGTLEYVDIGMSFDTRAIVNDLDVTNMGAVLGEDGWQSENVTQNYQNATSIATWGPRRSDIDISLYDQGPFAGSVETRAADMLDDDLELGKQPVWIRWNAQEAPALAASLEIYARVDIIFRGTTYQCRVVNLTHELTPTRWIVRMELIRK